MTLTPDVQVLHDEYLLPYVGGTRQLYTHYLDRYLDWCALQGYEPLTVTRADVERYVHHLHVELGLRASSVATALTPVRGFYRFGYHEGAMDRDPAVHARRPRYYYRPSDTLGLERGQLTAFLTAGADMGGRYYAAAFLLGCMALRASEACSLEVGDYHQTVRGHRVLEFIGKAGQPAQMPLPVPVLRALDAASDGRISGPILRRQDGQRLTRQGLNTIVATIGRRAGIDYRITSHVLRHAAITNALEAGASLRKVMDLARHSEPRTTMRYDRNRTQLDDHAVHALVSFIVPVGPLVERPAGNRFPPRPYVVQALRRHRSSSSTMPASTYSRSCWVANSMTFFSIMASMAVSRPTSGRSSKLDGLLLAEAVALDPDAQGGVGVHVLPDLQAHPVLFSDSPRSRSQQKANTPPMTFSWSTA